MQEKIRVGILGSTGSVGKQTLSAIKRHKDKFEVVLLACKKSKLIIEKQARDLGVRNVIIDDSEKLSDPETYNGCDIVVNAILDIDGLNPTVAILESNAKLATANKESLVVFGHHIVNKARKCEKEIIPIDSEHSAIYQCLEEENTPKRLILTASGGAFRDLTKEEIRKKSYIDALKHPIWSMGSKITIDCATLMNKGLEIIEARHLFNTKKIEVLIHKQSIVHSLVEFEDNSQKAVLSMPNLEIPILFALSKPHRLSSNAAPLDLSKIKELSFEEPNYDKYPCLNIARNVLNIDTDLSAAIMSLSNSVATDLFMCSKIGFYQIDKIINDCINKFNMGSLDSIKDVFKLKSEINQYVYSLYR